MRFPGRLPLARTRLTVELLEDRATPAATVDPFGPTGLVVVDAIPDRVNVVMTSVVNTPADQTRLAGTPFAAAVEPLGFGIFRVTLPAGTAAAAAVRYYSELPGVVSAAPDEVIRLARVPNDTSYGSLWGMSRISAPTAWDASVGSGNFVVAVIDSGVDYTHPDLAANMWRNPGEVPGDGIDNDGNGIVDDYFGANFVGANTGNPMDDNGHGTHVAGTIGAVGNNARGVAGVNWNVKIMALKFLGSNGSGATSDAVEALNYAVAKGAKVSNNSWGGGSYSSTLAAAVGRARTAGHIVVAAAGNNGRNIDSNPSYPASYEATYDNVVAVAATTSSDALASYSNYGPQTVLLAAPGSGILSTTPNNTYSSYSGTSMATPHVAGAIALLWDLHPDWTYRQVIDKLAASVDPVAGLAGRVTTGGRLNLAKLLQVASPPPAPAVAPGPAVTAAAFAGPAGTFNRVRFTFDTPIDPATFGPADVTSFTGPDGPITGANFTVTPVTGSGNTQFDVAFAPQTAPGTYTIVVGPDVRDTAGNLMNQNRNAIAGEVPGDRYTASASMAAPVTRTLDASGLPLPILDFQTTRSTISVTEDLLVSDLNVQLTLTHTYDSDLVIRLVGPLGQTVVLADRRGGSGDNYTGTLFDDEAGVPISAGRPSFSKPHRPEQPLAAFDDRNARGTWTLEVSDVAAADVGELIAWSLIITGVPINGQFGVSSFGFPDEPAPAADEPPTRAPARPPVAAVVVSPSAPSAVPPLVLGGETGLPVSFVAPESGPVQPADPAPAATTGRAGRAAASPDAATGPGERRVTAAPVPPRDLTPASAEGVGEPAAGAEWDVTAIGIA